MTDKYLLDNRAHHLRQAGSVEHQTQLFQLIRNPDWRKLKDSYDPSRRSLREDLVEAWGLAGDLNEKDLRQGKPPQHLADEFFCALAVAGLHVGAGNLPPPMLVALYKARVWSPEQVLRAAFHQADPLQRASTLGFLTEVLSGNYCDQAVQGALEAVRAAPPGVERGRTLAALATLFPEAIRQRIVAETIESAHKLEDPLDLAIVLCNVDPALRDERWRRVLQALMRPLLRESDPERMVVGLSILLNITTPTKQSDLLDRAMKAAASIRIEWFCTKAMIALASQLEAFPNLARKAVKLITVIPHAGTRAEFLSAILPCLTRSERSRAIEMVLDSLERHFSLTGILALSSAAPFLGQSDKSFRRACKLARDLWWDSTLRVTTLCSLARHSSPSRRDAIVGPLLTEFENKPDSIEMAIITLLLAQCSKGKEREQHIRVVLQTAQRMPNHDHRLRVLGATVGMLESYPDLLGKAAALMTNVSDQKEQIVAIGSSLGFLDPAARRDLTNATIALVAQIGDKEDRIKSLCQLLPYSNEIEELLDLATEILHTADKWQIPELVSLIVPALKDRPLICARVLLIISNIRGRRDRTPGYTALLPALPREWQSFVLSLAMEGARSITQGVGWQKDRVAAFTELARAAPAEHCKMILQELLSCMNELEIPDDRVPALRKIAPLIAKDAVLLKQALAVILEMPEQSPIEGAPRLRALLDLLEVIPSNNDLLACILEVVPQLGPSGHRSALLQKLVPCLPPHSSLFEEIFGQLDGLKSADCVQVIYALGQALREDCCRYPQLWLVADKFASPEERARSRVGLLSGCDAKRRRFAIDEVLNDVRQISQLETVVAILRDILPYLSPPQQTKMRSQILDQLAAIPDEYVRKVTLLQSIPVLVAPVELERAIEISRGFETHQYRLFCLQTIAPKLSNEKRREIMSALLNDLLLALAPDDHRSLSTEISFLVEYTDSADAYFVLRHILRRLAGYGRKRFWGELEQLLPLINKVGDAEAVAAFGKAVLAINEWERGPNTNEVRA